MVISPGAHIAKTPTTPIGRLLLSVEMVKPFAQSGAEAQSHAWNRVRDAVWGARENKFDVRKRFFEMVDKCPTDACVFSKKDAAKFQLLAKLADEVKRCERDCPRIQEAHSVVEIRATRSSTREQKNKRKRENEQSQETAETDRVRQQTTKHYTTTRGRWTVDPASDEVFIDLVAELKPHLEIDSTRSAHLWDCIGERLVGKPWRRSLKTQSLKLRFQYLMRVLEDTTHPEHKRLNRSLRMKLSEYRDQLTQHRDNASENEVKTPDISPATKGSTDPPQELLPDASESAKQSDKVQRPTAITCAEETHSTVGEPKSSEKDGANPKNKPVGLILPRKAADRRKHATTHERDFRGRMDQLTTKPKDDEDIKGLSSSDKLALHESFVDLLSRMDRNLHKEATQRMQLLALVVQSVQTTLDDH